MTSTRVPARGVFTLVRAADQMLVTVVMENLDIVGDGLTPAGDRPGFLTLVLPPQHTAESIPEGDPAPPAPYANRVAGPSQLRFRIDQGTVIPFSVEGLLGWTDRTLVLDPRAALTGSPYPTTEPTATYVELPQGLYLSPGNGGRFLTQARPRTFDGVTEVWRMRLGREIDVDGVPTVLEPPQTGVGMRAIWTDDHEPTVAADDWDTPVDEFPRLPTRLDQRHLVRAMGDHDMDAEYPAHEAAVCSRLWLSLHGGWLTASGSFSGPGLVAAWTQRVATGRDVHVRVARRGWLAPFGHVASVIEVADRTFLVDSGGGVTAALRQREFLSVSPNRVDMASLAPAMPHAGRELPFQVVDLVSAFVVEIARSPIPGVVDAELVFLPTHDSDGTRVIFDYLATDRIGAHQVTFALPGVFVRTDASTEDVAAVIAHYAGAGSADIRVADLGGQPIAYADEPPGSEGDGKTTLPTSQMSFTLNEPSAGLPDEFAALVPAMDTAAVVDAKVDALRGQDAEPFTVSMADGWLQDGLDLSDNVALGFLDLDAPITLPFSGGGSGITAPNLTVEQLTALIGPSIKLVAGGEWDPKVALGLLEDQALFMGSVQLSELIDKINIGGDILAEQGLPRYDIELKRPDPDALPDELCISLTWNPTLRSFGDTLLAAQDIRDDPPFPAGAQGELDFLLKSCLPLDDLDAEPAITVDVAVRNIMIQLPPPEPIIAVAFTKVRFFDPPDGPADVDVEIAAVRFLGALTFLEPIQEFLAGLGGGPRLDIRDDAVEADLTFPLPDIALGVLGITGLEVGTGLVIDLTGGPLRAAFNLGTRADPFTLSVMGFGGSGSVELEASPHPVGIVSLELSFAFVMEISVNVVVAKGTLRASFGASLELTATLVDGEPSADVTLGAFLDILGEVEVFGFISIVVQVLLTLEYTASTSLLVGEATVTASVDVGFIEKEASFTISQEFALGDGSGARARLMSAAAGPAGPAAGGFVTRFPTSPLWNQYCAAFAA